MLEIKGKQTGSINRNCVQTHTDEHTLTQISKCLSLLLEIIILPREQWSMNRSSSKGNFKIRWWNSRSLRGNTSKISFFKCGHSATLSTGGAPNVKIPRANFWRLGTTISILWISLDNSSSVKIFSLWASEMDKNFKPKQERKIKSSSKGHPQIRLWTTWSFIKTLCKVICFRERKLMA